MVTINKIGNSYNKTLIRMDCLSTDTKPIGEIDGIVLYNGSMIRELDTGKKYLYDEAAKEWHEVSNSSGGGGGGTGSGINVVHFELDQSQITPAIICDKTPEEVISLMDGQNPVVFTLDLGNGQVINQTTLYFAMSLAERYSVDFMTFIPSGSGGAEHNAISVFQVTISSSGFTVTANGSSVISA